MIDWDRVTELRDEIGPEDFDEVVEIFLEEVEEVVVRLRGGPGGSLEDDMHFLKGSALNLGFAKLAALSAAAERNAAAGKAVDPGAAVACYENSRAEFVAGLEQRSAAA